MPSEGGVLSITQETPLQPDALELLRQSDETAHALYPPVSNHLVPAEALTGPDVRFFLARRDGAAIGCAALLLNRDGSAELKRMFVDESARGHGVARRLLLSAEQAARDAGTMVLRLETGTRSLAAIALYRRCGFAERDPFGTYRPDPFSVFMEKRL